MKQKLYCG